MELVARDGQYMPAKQARKTFALLAPHLAKKRKWSSDVWRIENFMTGRRCFFVGRSVIFVSTIHYQESGEGTGPKIRRQLVFRPRKIILR